MTTPNMEWDDAMRAIISNSHEKALNYAVNYAREGLRLRDPHSRGIQALYILNNISRWRGDTARNVREALKAYGKVAS